MKNKNKVTFNGKEYDLSKFLLAFIEQVDYDIYKGFECGEYDDSMEDLANYAAIALDKG